MTTTSKLQRHLGFFGKTSASELNQFPRGYSLVRPSRPPPSTVAKEGLKSDCEFFVLFSDDVLAPGSLPLLWLLHTRTSTSPTTMMIPATTPSILDSVSVSCPHVRPTWQDGDYTSN